MSRRLFVFISATSFVGATAIGSALVAAPVWMT